MKSADTPRSESDILLKQIVVKFGDKEYAIPVLRMKQAAVWRKEYFEKTQEISASMIVDGIGDKTEMTKSVGNALTAALLKFPDKIPELVFSYASSFSPQERETILDEAYDEDFTRAFGDIYKAAFQPFLASLGTVLEMQRAQGSRSPSSAS